MYDLNNMNEDKSMTKNTEKDSEKPKLTTKGEWADQLMELGDEQLKEVPLGVRASCFQALAIKCFQRSTELAADSMIAAIDDAFSNSLSVPPGFRSNMSKALNQIKDVTFAEVKNVKH